MKKLFYLILFTAFFQTACQKETVVERVIEKPPTTQIGGGTGDYGGGNGIDGKPLESFKINLSNLVEGKKVNQIIETVYKIYPQLASDMKYIVEARQWFLIPVELNKIPEQVIGVGFKTEQLAIQSRREIWISDIYFSKMKSEDKVNLIIHEIMMGIRFIEFQSDLENCLSQTYKYLLMTKNEFSNTDSDESIEQQKLQMHKSARKSCFDIYNQFPNLTPLKLTEDDYSNIRDLTTKVIFEIHQLTTEDIELWLNKTKFRIYKK